MRMPSSYFIAYFHTPKVRRLDTFSMKLMLPSIMAAIPLSMVAAPP